MDQVKIGRFIAERRKSVELTQAELAERLGITDRAISKWETGRSMPDSSIMLLLCEELGITVNDLLNGEVVSMDHYNKKLEDHLFDMIKEKERADKRLLRMEILVGILCLLPLIGAIIAVNTVPMEEWLGGLIAGLCVLPLFLATPFMLRIEQTAGYYECARCHHRYVPTYKSVAFAMHMHTTRYMRCPECRKRSWHKKVLDKNGPT